MLLVPAPDLLSRSLQLLKLPIALLFSAVTIFNSAVQRQYMRWINFSWFFSAGNEQVSPCAGGRSGPQTFWLKELGVGFMPSCGTLSAGVIIDGE